MTPTKIIVADIHLKNPGDITDWTLLLREWDLEKNILVDLKNCIYFVFIILTEVKTRNLVSKTRIYAKSNITPHSHRQRLNIIYCPLFTEYYL